MTPAPIKIFRDPTRKDVEELCAEKGMELQVWPGMMHGAHYPPQWREFHAVAADGSKILLGDVPFGERPDWRAMLQKLGSDWA